MKKTMNRLTVVSSMLLLGMLAVMSCSKESKEPEVQMKPMPTQQPPAASATGGQMAPGFNLPDVEGGNKTLADYKGKVVMLNFWATWCGPCKREIPDFIDLQKTYGGKGLEIVGVALDEPSDVRAFVKANNMNYDVLIGGQDIAMAYGNIRSIPTTFLLNRQGEIVGSWVGLRSKDVWVKDIQGLL